MRTMDNQYLYIFETIKGYPKMILICNEFTYDLMDKTCDRVDSSG